ncbi:MAG: hypothetical protein JZU53_01685 [Paludibacter sp.]|nr:hypothetical protein [Paludibacter sp.]
MKPNIILLFLLLSMSVFSQKNVYGFGGGITKIGYQIDVETGYKLNRHLTISLNYRFQTIETGGYYDDSNKNYEWQIDDDNLLNFLLIPSVRFSLPILKENNRFWSLYIEPGIMIQPLTYEVFDVVYQAIEKPYKGQIIWTDRAKGDFKLARFYWQNKFAIQCGSRASAGGIFVGFELSNQDVYSKRRSVVVDGVSLDKHLPSKTKLYNSIFIGLRGYL